ncbi:hypothetical protein, partial [Intrasporangium sp.]|uniref:hypothetical protein n=1 Tax=Intrasporangium sp. TaxID=1925024 RepID=UPI0032220E82
RGGPSSARPEPGEPRGRHHQGDERLTLGTPGGLRLKDGGMPPTRLRAARLLPLPARGRVTRRWHGQQPTRHRHLALSAQHAENRDAGLSADEVAASLGAAGIDYALTDNAGANFYRSSAGEAWPVRYVKDVVRAAEAAGLVRMEPGSFGMRVTLIPFDGVSGIGRVDTSGVTVAVRDQVVIDAYGGIDRMVEQADILTGRRSPQPSGRCPIGRRGAAWRRPSGLHSLV